MTTERLICRLSSELKSARPHSLEMAIFASAIAGATVGLVAFVALFGVRSDFVAILSSFSFWMKAGYAGAIALLAIMLLNDFARPERDPTPKLVLFAAPIILLGLLAGAELLTNSASGWRDLFLGMSAGECSVRIAFFALPTFFILMAAFRRFAPTQLTKTGAVIGAAAGAVGALIYMLYCREFAASFVLIWYSLGILSMAALGALLGPELLKWK